MNKPASCDIFCAVVDNYGDIGVCWRLARQLSQEHGMAVRLWVDDLESFSRLCPDINPELPVQACRGVKVKHWAAETLPSTPQPLSRPAAPPLPHVGAPKAGNPLSSKLDAELTQGLGERGEVADLVIESFACKLPESYVAAMAGKRHKPIWINLEYLSAEEWVDGCHGLPSPHSSLPLVKYFFFPGFTPKTGGLLLERDLLRRRDAFLNDAQARAAWWQACGILPPVEGTICVSLFCYENANLPELLESWAGSGTPVRCLLPEGRALPQVAEFFGQSKGKPGDIYRRGNLELCVLSFVEQERYDELLWVCDINFVRGEDSCVRAQWAGKPFIWHIYPQHDGVHMQKLAALLKLYCAGLPPEATRAQHGLWEWWNGGAGGVRAWNDFLAQRPILEQRAGAWAGELSRNSLALNLLDFFREVDRMRGS